MTEPAAEPLAKRWDLATIAKDNLSTVLAVITAAGFLVGAISVKALSKGLGSSAADFGLDLRGTVTVAATTAIYPALLVGLLLVLIALARLTLDKMPLIGSVPLFVGLYGAATFPVTFVLFGRAMPVWCSFAASGVVIIAFLIVGFSSDSNKVIFGTMGAVLLGLALAASAFGSYRWGRAISDGSWQDLLAPVAIDLALPTSRGYITLGDTRVCVDRVGQRLFIGEDAQVMLNEPTSFVIVDCDREDIKSLALGAP